ncbi:MAG: hypothetical protein ACR2G7_05745 [Acidimicrobiales bacterium]
MVSDDGRHLGLAEALGTGGRQLEELLGGLLSPSAVVGDPAQASWLAERAACTPAGAVSLALEAVDLAAGAERAAGVDPEWLAAVDRRRQEPRSLLVADGRSEELEAALHVAMLLAVEALDPDDDADVAAHMASGAQLWLLGAAVAWSLADAGANPFRPWAELVAAGLWPIGPVGDRLVVGVPEALRLTSPGAQPGPPAADCWTIGVAERPRPSTNRPMPALPDDR